MIYPNTLSYPEAPVQCPLFHTWNTATFFSWSFKIQSVPFVILAITSFSNESYLKCYICQDQFFKKLSATSCDLPHQTSMLLSSFSKLLVALLPLTWPHLFPSPGKYTLVSFYHCVCFELKIKKENPHSSNGFIN